MFFRSCITHFLAVAKVIALGIRSGQECLTCTFRARCCSACRFLCPGQGGGGGEGVWSKGGPSALAGTREYEKSDQNQ